MKFVHIDLAQIFLIASVLHRKRSWFSGIITACHAVDPSSILGLRTLFGKSYKVKFLSSMDKICNPSMLFFFFGGTDLADQRTNQIESL
jgi:hypothetical protein